MAKTSFFIEETPHSFLEAYLRKEAERGVDELELKIPPTLEILDNQDVKFLVDKVDTSFLRIMLPLQRVLMDESGYDNHVYGTVKAPRFDFLLKYENNLTDSGFRNVTMTETGGNITYDTGRVGSFCAVFNGTPYMSASDESFFDYDFSNFFSVSFFIKSSNTGVAEAIISKCSTNTSAGWEVSFDSSNKLHFKMRNTASTNELDVSYDTSIKDNLWHHVCITYDGLSSASGVKFYKDGALVSTTTNVNNLTATLQNNIALTIGAYGGGTSKITASLDNVGIISKIITAEQATGLYQKGIISYVNGNIGYAIDFNGVDTSFYIPHSTNIDLSTTFDIYFWVNTGAFSGTQTIFNKSSTATNGIEFSIRGAAATAGYTSTGYTSTGYTTQNIPGTAKLRIGSTELNGTIDFSDSSWHLIRLTRNSSNLVSIYVDNVLDNSATVSTSISTTANFTFGKNYAGSQFFQGNIQLFRVYVGGFLTSDEATTLNTITNNPLSIMKFGGRVTKMTKDLAMSNVLAQSHGEDLGNIDVTGLKYNNRSPEQIIEDILYSESSLTPNIFATASGVTITKFNADGKLIDIIKDLMNIAGVTFYTDGNKQFYLIDRTFNTTSLTFTHGVNSTIDTTENNHSELVNDLLVIGETQTFLTEELQSGTGTKTIFSLNHVAASLKVEHPVGTIKNPDTDYTLDTLKKEVTFTSAPASGTNNVKFTYDYSEPLFIRGTNPSSIAQFGTHAKRLLMNWIRTREDGIRFINAYLDRYSTITQSIEVNIPGLYSTIREADVITCTNSLKNIAGGFIVKSIEYKYPDMNTILKCGEFTFSSFEDDKDIANKIHDLESIVIAAATAELQSTEEFLETLALTDVFITYEALADGTNFTESMGMTDVFTETQMFDAIYDDAGTFYDSDDCYV